MDHESDKDPEPHCTMVFIDGDGKIIATAHVTVDPKQQKVACFSRYMKTLTHKILAGTLMGLTVGWIHQSAVAKMCIRHDPWKKLRPV
jgi:hypothetical protein